MSISTIFANWLKGPAPVSPQPRHSYVLLAFSSRDHLLAECPLKVTSSDPEWSITTLESSGDGEALGSGKMQYCVLKRDGEPVAFMLAEELFNIVDLDVRDTLVIEKLSVQFGTTATRTLP